MANGCRTSFRWLASCLVLAVFGLTPSLSESADYSQAERLVCVDGNGLSIARLEGDVVRNERVVHALRRVTDASVLPNGKIVWFSGEQLSTDLVHQSYSGFDVAFLGSTRRPLLCDSSGISGGGICLSADGQHIAYVASSGTGSTLYRENLLTGEIVPLTQERLVLMAPSWSPDGSMIAYYCSTGHAARSEGGLCLNVVDLNAGKESQVAPPSRRTNPSGENRHPPVWSTTSERLFFEGRYADDSADSWVYEVNPRKPARPVRISRGLCYSASMTKDAIYIVDKGIHELRFEDNGMRRTILVDPPAGHAKSSPSGEMLAFTTQDGLWIQNLHSGQRLSVTKNWNWGDRFFWIAPRVSASLGTKPE